MMPKHIAVAMERDISQWAEHNNRNIKDVYDSRNEIINSLIRMQIEQKIPVLTVFLVSLRSAAKNFDVVVDNMADFFTELAKSQFISENQVKVSVLGKWYNLPNRVVDVIKCVIDETKDFDRYFVNFCIMYDGQEEIVDACRLLGRRIEADKLDPEAITPEMVKEDIYTSYFIAPELVIINGQKILNGFLLWDIGHAMIYFTGKHWPDFDVRDFKKAVDLFGLLES